MRRTGNLFARMLERENLSLAATKALRGKRTKHDAREFVGDLDWRLARMAAEVAAGTIRLGMSHQFLIHDPKERLITAPCFEERVLHHAIMNVCEPVFERRLIDATYACRKGKGRIACLLRTREFAHRYPCFLKLDIRKYFDSIPHDVLLGRLSRKFKDARLLRLWERIVGSHARRPWPTLPASECAGMRSPTDAGSVGHGDVGLPIGSLTSQHFANFYLGEFDRFVKETLRVKGYVRYMDDMALWGRSTAELTGRLAECRDFLRDELRLELKAEPYVNFTRHGMDFLGCRVFPSHMVLNRRSRVRFRRRLIDLERRHEAGEISEAALQHRAESLVVFTRTAGVCSWKFRTAVLQGIEVGGHRPRTA